MSQGLLIREKKYFSKYINQKTSIIIRVSNIIIKYSINYLYNNNNNNIIIIINRLVYQFNRLFFIVWSRTFFIKRKTF